MVNLGVNSAYSFNNKQREKEFSTLLCTGFTILSLVVMVGVTYVAVRTLYVFNS